MAGISTGGGGGGKKAVDSEIPLVPFIDLLLCCIMFLLVTAVWNQLARINANQQSPGSESFEEPPPEEEKLKLYLVVLGTGYQVLVEGSEPTEVAKRGSEYDVEKLRKELEVRKKADPSRKDIIVVPEDAVHYDVAIQAMDIAVGVGFEDLALADKSALPAGGGEA